MTAVEPNTAMRAAFGRSGLKPEDAKLDLALAEYLNVTDGDVDRLQFRVKLAIDKLSGKGHVPDARDGQSPSAQPRQPFEDDKGQAAVASNGQPEVAESSSSNRDGNGQSRVARDGQKSNVVPVREPSASQRAATERVKDASARVVLTAMQRNKTTDGQAWGRVGEHELSGKGRDGAVAMAIDAFLGPRGPKQRFKPLDELLTDEQFETILTRVRGQNHAA